MMSCYICKSTERKRGDFWYFVQKLVFKINSTSFQLYTLVLFFLTSPEMSQFYSTSDRRVKCKGSQSASTRQRVLREPISVDYQCATKSRSAWKQSLIVRYDFRAEFNLKIDEPPRARWTELAGRIWPAGRTLPTPDLMTSYLLSFTQNTIGKYIRVVINHATLLLLSSYSSSVFTSYSLFTNYSKCIMCYY